MKSQTIGFCFLLSSVLVLFYSCKSGVSGDNSEIYPSASGKSSLSVIDVSGNSNNISSYKIDGLLSSNVSHIIGNTNSAASYIPVEAGLRKLSIGNYSDTVRIEASNYYTVFVYDQDSVELSLDAPYSNNQFNTIPQVRWLFLSDLTDADGLKVDFDSDSLLRDIKVNSFTPVTYSKEKIKLLVYGPNKVEIASVDVPVSLNRKETVVITKDPVTKLFSFSITSQNSKP